MTTTPPSATAPAAAPPTLRNRATRAVRAEIAAVAVRLFLAQGFDKTTVDQVAAEAGLSRASFFRYFGSKEDVLLGHLEELGHKVADALAARPAHEPAWQALRRSFDPLITERLAYPDEGLTIRRILHDTPSLQARPPGQEPGGVSSWAGRPYCPPRSPAGSASPASLTTRGRARWSPPRWAASTWPSTYGPPPTAPSPCPTSWTRRWTQWPARRGSGSTWRDGTLPAVPTQVPCLASRLSPASYVMVRVSGRAES